MNQMNNNDHKVSFGLSFVPTDEHFYLTSQEEKALLKERKIKKRGFKSVGEVYNLLY